MSEAKETSGQAPSSEEAVEMSTSEETGVKMSTVQIALLMFALCVRILHHSINTVFINQSVLYFPRGPRYHHCNDSASNHLEPLPLIFGLHLGRCRLYACRCGLYTSVG